MKIGHWNMAQRWRNFKRPASSKGMWKQFVEDNQWPLVAQSVIPEEWDELSPKEERYYQQGPFSTHEDFRGAKGGTVPQLVQPEPGRQGYSGDKTVLQVLRENIEEKGGAKVFQFEKGVTTDGYKKNGLIDKVIKNTNTELSPRQISKLIDQISTEKGWLTKQKYRKWAIVDSYMKDYGINDEFTGAGKFDSRLKEFQLKYKGNEFREINKTFKNWIKGDFEVEGYDRSKFDKHLKKNLKNWKPAILTEKMAQLETELKWLNNVNTKYPDWTQERVEKAFNNKFKKNKDWSDTTFKNRSIDLYGTLVHGQTKNGRVVEGVDKGNRSKWVKEVMGEVKGGNYYRFLTAADKYEADGNMQAAKKLRNAAKDLFLKDEGVFYGLGQAEHPWFSNYGGTKGMLQIDSLVKGDLNAFKANNFEIPIRDLIKQYEAKGVSDLQKKRILDEINLRRNFLNITTDIGDGGMARNVTFDSMSTPGKIKVINKTPDIYGVHKAGKLDPLKLQAKGTDYRNKVIQNLTDVDVNILKKDETIKTGKIGATRMNEIIKAYQKAGIGNKCQWKGKAEGGRIGFAEAGVVDDDCMRNAINEHKRKLADGNEAAIKKQMKINQTKGLKNMFTTGRKGLQSIISGVGLNNPGALALEAAIEAAFYGYGRQEGESHEQARENLFFPKIMAKYAPGLWEELGFKPFKTGVWEGPEKLIEEELIGTRWDPSGKVNLAAEYADGMKALEDEYANASKIDFELGILNNQWRPGSEEQIEAKEQELRDSYDRIEELQINIKEGTPIHDAYVAAQEKQKALQDKRAQDYYGDSPAYKGSKKRQWQEEFLDYRGADRKYRKEQPFAFKGGIADAIVKPGTRIDWDAYADYGWDKPEQKWKDLYDTGGWDLMDRIGIAGGVSKMSQGGRASYLDGGIVSLLKK